MSDITDTLPLRAWQFDNVTVTDPKTHKRIDVYLPALIPEIENLRLENLQHPKQAVEANDRECFKLKTRISEEQKQKYALLSQIKFNVQVRQRNGQRRLAHLDEDDYIIPRFPNVNTSHGQFQLVASCLWHHFVCFRQRTTSKMAAIYFPAGDSEVEDAYNHNQSDHATRWMADSLDMHGAPVSGSRYFLASCAAVNLHQAVGGCLNTF